MLKCIVFSNGRRHGRGSMKLNILSSKHVSLLERELITAEDEKAKS